MEPSKYIKQLIHLNDLNIIQNADKARVQEEVLRKYHKLNLINKILYKDFPKPKLLLDEGFLERQEKRKYKQTKLKSQQIKPTESIISVTSTATRKSPQGPHRSTTSTVSEISVRSNASKASSRPASTTSKISIASTVPKSGPGQGQTVAHGKTRVPQSLKLPHDPPIEKINTKEQKPIKPPEPVYPPLKYYPKNKPPPTIILPFYEQEGDAHMNEYVEASSKTRGGILRKFKKGRDDPMVPGWLVEIPKYYLVHIRHLKEVLTKIENPVNPMEELELLYTIIHTDMRLQMISKAEICYVLKRIPMSRNEIGLSFGHFMLALGSPRLAAKKRIYLAFPRKFSCYIEEEVFEEEEGKEEDETELLTMPKQGRRIPSPRQQIITKKGMHHYGALSDYLYKFDVNREEEEALLRAQMEEEERSYKLLREEAAAHLRKQVFFSGLLAIQMFETVKNIQKLLNQHWIPPAGKHMDYKHIAHETSVSGIKKRGLAQWDISKPKIPSISPYLSPRPLCVPRLEIHLPSDEDKNTKNENIKVKFMHYMVHAPPANNIGGPIKLTENREIIHRALKYLASQGDCLAMLPDFEYLLHFGDADVDKTEEIHRAKKKKTKPKTPVLPLHSEAKNDVENSKDIAWIIEEAKKQYVEPKLPKRLTKVNGLVPVTYARLVRRQVQKIQDEHWMNAEKQREKFRSELWKRLDVLSIPSGNIRDNFVYAFMSLMPNFPHLSPVHNKNPWHF